MSHLCRHHHVCWEFCHFEALDMFVHHLAQWLALWVYMCTLKGNNLLYVVMSSCFLGNPLLGRLGIFQNSPEESPESHFSTHLLMRCFTPWSSFKAGGFGIEERLPAAHSSARLSLETICCALSSGPDSHSGCFHVGWSTFEVCAPCLSSCGSE